MINKKYWHNYPSITTITDNIDGKSNYISFDEVCDQNQAGGSSPKVFVRVRGSEMKNLYDDVLANENFLTCVDSLIRDNDFSRENFNNFYISSIVKQISPESVTSEVLASRIASLMGVSTAYTEKHCDGDKVISVDFLKGKQQFCTLEDILIPGCYVLLFYIGRNQPNIKIYIDALRKSLDDKIPNDYPNKSQTILNAITELIRQYIFRVYIINDEDFTPYNIGLVCDEGDFNYSIAPMFDCELSLSASHNLISSTKDFYPLLRDLEYVFNEYPLVLSRIVNDYMRPSKKEIVDIVKGNIKSSFKSMLVSNYILKQRKTINNIFHDLALNSCQEDEFEIE